MLSCILLCYYMLQEIRMLTREKIKWQECYHGYHGNDLDDYYTATVFASVNSALSESMVNGRILMKFVMTTF
jgi:hypothetical protein